MSQVQGIWLGQGSYYVLLALGGYIAYRTLLDGATGDSGMLRRVADCELHVGVIVLFGMGLAAAGLLPQLEYNQDFNLATGYSNLRQAGESGWDTRSWLHLVRLDRWYTGAVVLGLAAGAPLLARRKYAVPYWVLLSLVVVFLARQRSTPLYSLVYLLPRFEELHSHAPARVLTVFYVAPALLAAATLDEFGRRLGRMPYWAVLPSVGLLLGMVAARIAVANSISTVFVVAALLAAALLLVAVLVPGSRNVVVWAMPILVTAELLVAGQVELAERSQLAGAHSNRKVDLTTYYEPRDAAQFLLQKARAEHFRYFGYEPYLRGRLQAYPPRWTNPLTLSLLVNSHATMLGLQGLQGYNPVHVARYDTYMRALNEGPQGYRSASVLPQGLDSPLLDLLNARYIVVPSVAPPGRADLQWLNESHQAVYEDGQVRALERATALPRAWVVHQARRVSRARVLDMLSTQAVDPRRLALLPEAPPQAFGRAEGAVDEVQITHYGPDRIRLSVTTTAPGHLVLSEVYYPAWKAEVNGQAAQMYAPNNLLRAVPVPAGRSDVELWYESAALTIALLISSACYVALACIARLGILWWRRQRLIRDPS